jgi:hypothetical protein
MERVKCKAMVRAKRLVLREPDDPTPPVAPGARYNTVWEDRHCERWAKLGGYCMLHARSLNEGTSE